MTTYNGHINYNAWNISLWINNDESLYNMARDFIRLVKGRRNAANEMLKYLEELGITKTPDGVRYTKTNIMLAMREM